MPALSVKGSRSYAYTSGPVTGRTTCGVGQLIYLMLADGDKGTQQRDIDRAILMARELRAEAKAAKRRKPK